MYHCIRKTILNGFHYFCPLYFWKCRLEKTRWTEISQKIHVIQKYISTEINNKTNFWKLKIFIWKLMRFLDFPKHLLNIFIICHFKLYHLHGTLYQINFSIGYKYRAIFRPHILFLKIGIKKKHKNQYIYFVLWKKNTWLSSRYRTNETIIIII